MSFDFVILNMSFEKLKLKCCIKRNRHPIFKKIKEKSKTNKLKHREYWPGNLPFFYMPINFAPCKS